MQVVKASENRIILESDTRKAGYKSVVEFVEEVAKNYEVIKEGNSRNGVQTYLLQLTDKNNNTLIVELSGDGTYWNINTAGIFRTTYGANRKEVYNRHATVKQSAETAEASLSGEQSGTAPSTSMNAPTSSASKGSKKVSIDQGKERESEGEQAGAGYSIGLTTYTNKKGKTTPMHLVTFGRELSKDEIRAGKELAKESRGWWDREKGGFMMRDEDSAKAFAEALSNKETVQEAQPLSIEDVATVTDRARKKEKPQHNQPASSDKSQQDLTTGSSVDNDAERGAKVVIFKRSAKHELNNLIHKYVGQRKTRGFISDLAIALGDRSNRPKQTL